MTTHTTLLAFFLAVLAIPNLFAVPLPAITDSDITTSRQLLAEVDNNARLLPQERHTYIPQVFARADVIWQKRSWWPFSSGDTRVGREKTGKKYQATPYYVDPPNTASPATGSSQPDVPVNSGSGASLVNGPSRSSSGSSSSSSGPTSRWSRYTSPLRAFRSGRSTS